MSKRLKYSIIKLKSYLRHKLLGKYAVGVIYDTKNGKISAPIDDFMVGKKLGFKGEYDMSEVNMLKGLIKEADTLYIVGVHWGTLLIPLSKHCENIVGYEANPTTFKFLENNLLLNHVNNVSLFNKAAGDSTRTVKFYKSTINSGGSKIKPKVDKYMYKYDDPDTIEVDMVNVDIHQKENTLPRANGIIMDIEGAEFYALQGMKETLKDSRFLYIEYVPHHLQNVSNTSNEVFFDLILPFYKTVTFMNDKENAINLEQNKDVFFNKVNALMTQGKSDNLLFSS